MQKSLARAGYRTTREVEAGEETIFLWHPAYYEGLMAVGWAIKSGSWGAYGRDDDGASRHLGQAPGLDQALAAVVAWDDARTHLR